MRHVPYKWTYMCWGISLFLKTALSSSKLTTRQPRSLRKHSWQYSLHLQSTNIFRLLNNRRVLRCIITKTTRRLRDSDMLLHHVVMQDKSHLIHLEPHFPYLLSLPKSQFTSHGNSLWPHTSMSLNLLRLEGHPPLHLVTPSCSIHLGAAGLYSPAPMFPSQNTNHTRVWLFPWSSVPLEDRNCFCLFVCLFQFQTHQYLVEHLTKRMYVERVCWANEWIWKSGIWCSGSLRPLDPYSWISLRSGWEAEELILKSLGKQDGRHIKFSPTPGLTSLSGFRAITHNRLWICFKTSVKGGTWVAQSLSLCL